MPDQRDQSRTEAPTQRRREEARKKGQFARSADLAGSLLVLAVLLLFKFSSRAFGQNLLDGMRNDLQHLHQGDWQTLDVLRVAADHAWQITSLAIPVVACASLTAMLLGFFLTKFGLSTNPLKPELNRLSPAKGLGRMFSMTSGVRGIADVMKLLVVTAVVWWSVDSHLAKLSHVHNQSLLQAAAKAWQIALVVAIRIAGVFVVLGLADYAFQWWRNEESLKMSREEIKEEQKQDLGDPIIRTRIRKMQREARNRQMLRQVPEATVILTNPTHLAVALRYDRHKMAAPVVVAKGANHLAKRIVRVARQHQVPVLERKPLARALYQAAEVNQEIPIALYRAVAEILAYVYRLDKAA